MSLRHIPTFALILVSMITASAVAQHVVPSALLTIDQNRTTVVERIVGEWGDRLASSSAGITSAQLREILSGLRSDHLLAASLAGSVEGLRDVVSGALVRTGAAVSAKPVRTKSLGDTTFDLVYTPVVPCRIVDTRSGGGGVFLPTTQRDWLAYSPSGFASQGGSGTNCGIPVRPVAVIANTTLANTVGGPEFFTLWPFNQTRPTASTVNWWGPAQQPANAEIVPLCTGTCTSDFSAYASGQTHAIIDVLGYFNRPTNYGGTHVITGTYATDSGGFNNTASGNYSAVAGGYGNIASNDYSTVAGGLRNTASGLYSTVAGGTDNTADGQYSMVAGGLLNRANTLSFAAGGGAKANGIGTFVWADSQPPDFVVDNFNAFWVRATGGANFVTNIDGSGNPIRAVAILPNAIVDFGSNTRQMINLYGGATFGIGIQTATQYYRSNTGFAWFQNGVHSDTTNDAGPGGTTLMTLDGTGKLFAHGFGTISDRNAKRDFATVDSLNILDKVVALPISTWSYNNDPTTRHIGPMAQDFAAAFAVGPDDKHIMTVDADGVVLAAIQGLHQMMQQKDQEIAQLRRKLQAIEAKLGL
jgi:hypothetical protein